MKFFIFLNILILAACQAITKQPIERQRGLSDSINAVGLQVPAKKHQTQVLLLGKPEKTNLDFFFSNNSKLHKTIRVYYKEKLSVSHIKNSFLYRWDIVKDKSKDTTFIRILSVDIDGGEKYNLIVESGYDIKNQLFRGNGKYDTIVQNKYPPKQLLLKDIFSDTLWSSQLPEFNFQSLNPYFIQIGAKKYLALEGLPYRATGIGVNKSTCVFWDLDTGAYYQSDSFLCSADCFNDFDGDGKLNFLSFNLQDRTIVKGEKVETWYYTMQNLAVLGDTLLPIASPFDSLLLEEKRLGHFKMLKK